MKGKYRLYRNNVKQKSKSERPAKPVPRIKVAMDALRQSSTVLSKRHWKYTVQGTLQSCSQMRSPSAGVQRGAGVEAAISKAVTVCSQEEPDTSL